ESVQCRDTRSRAIRCFFHEGREGWIPRHRTGGLPAERLLPSSFRHGQEVVKASRNHAVLLQSPRFVQGQRCVFIHGSSGSPDLRESGRHRGVFVYRQRPRKPARPARTSGKGQVGGKGGLRIRLHQLCRGPWERLAVSLP
ncbi:unnamed protein product, partial [Ixodes pacificus]